MLLGALGSGMYCRRCVAGADHAEVRDHVVGKLLGEAAIQRTCQIGEIAEVVLHRWDMDQARIDSLRGSCSLIIGKEKRFIAANRTAKSSSELVLVKGRRG